MGDVARQLLLTEAEQLTAVRLVTTGLSLCFVCGLCCLCMWRRVVARQHSALRFAEIEEQAFLITPARQTLPLYTERLSLQRLKE
jgi:hypothetical protein